MILFIACLFCYGNAQRIRNLGDLAFAMDIIANIRTDLDAFSEVEQAVLMNHGYALMDAAIRTHVPDLIVTDAPFALPRPEFAVVVANEDELKRRLSGSEKRRLAGRMS